MSFAEILEEPSTLTPEEREKIVARAVALDLQSEISPGVRDEVCERLDALDADPSLAVPWEGTKETVFARLDAILASKAVHH